MIERYTLIRQKMISEVMTCQGCGGWYHIQERVYHDNNNPNTDNEHKTSVRTACMCTPEVDPFLERNKRNGLEETNILTPRGFRSVRAKNN